MLLTLLYFFLALFLLITIHEFGHFWVARLCGVKVLRFSFGFGKVIAKWHDRKGTEYAWSLLPLGGYVKMLDESEGEVLPEEKHLAFNNKSVWQRIAIVLAGPVFNLLFAFVCLWLVLIIGIKSLAPMIEDVKPGTPAAHAGLTAKEEIIAMEDRPITSWRDFQYAFMPLVGSDEKVSLTVKSMLNGQHRTLWLSLHNWEINPKKPDLLGSLGIVPFIPSIPPVIGEVMNGSPAEQAGLQVGDRIQTMDKQKLGDWLVLVEFVRYHPGQVLQLSVLRKDKLLEIPVTIGTKNNEGQSEGFLGVKSEKVNWPPQWLRLQREAPLPALKIALQQTVELTGATFSLIGRFVTGQLGLDTLSGPVGIAQGAGESGRSGIAYYLSFLALVSISLGVLNLLPVPMLDGGHLLFYMIELVTRKPLSEEFRTIGLYIGLAFLVTLMFLALTNDLSRLTG
ncbi:membrane-associated Zn-dependent protease EcfE [Legionella birminghamensis]|uniref:Zinc metalloprotease n=1 Tax=Legionella birminghamensis TaxID=28083 RepID=A0A378ICY1_9GAMM|nr:RIP metalloprotease RseP [Legionella birminghamensis]KTC75464.1 membrane-associated Zn-dependent protease EcfE [Legionella birminghamensis]STX32690.1 membrane-associated Zn-dependent protease EcfE [Legionella birminghamensis]